MAELQELSHRPTDCEQGVLDAVLSDHFCLLTTPACFNPQEKICKLYERKLQEGFDTNNHIQKKKEFRNPRYEGPNGGKITPETQTARPSAPGAAANNCNKRT